MANIEAVKALGREELKRMDIDELLALLASYENDLSDAQKATVVEIIENCDDDYLSAPSATPAATPPPKAEDAPTAPEPPEPAAAAAPRPRAREPEVVYEAYGSVRQPVADAFSPGQSPAAHTPPTSPKAGAAEVVYEASGRLPQRRESRFRGAQQITVLEGSNDVDAYAFLPSSYTQARSLLRRGSSCAPRIERTSSVDEDDARPSLDEMSAVEERRESSLDSRVSSALRRGSSADDAAVAYGRGSSADDGGVPERKDSEVGDAARPPALTTPQRAFLAKALAAEPVAGYTSLREASPDRKSVV